MSRATSVLAVCIGLAYIYFVFIVFVTAEMLFAMVYIPQRVENGFKKASPETQRQKINIENPAVDSQDMLRI